MRATEEAVTLYKKGEKPQQERKPAAAQPQYFTDSAERLSDRFDTKVTVTMGKRKGKMVVEFGDQEDFERILALIEGNVLVESVKEGVTINPLAARSVGSSKLPSLIRPLRRSLDPAMLLSHGDCGLTVGDEATVFFCPPEYAPGAAKLPSSPVSEDAAILSSLFVKSHRAARGLEAVLLDAAVMNLTSRDFSAVEALATATPRRRSSSYAKNPPSSGCFQWKHSNQRVSWWCKTTQLRLVAP